MSPVQRLTKTRNLRAILSCPFKGDSELDERLLKQWCGEYTRGRARIRELTPQILAARMLSTATWTVTPSLILGAASERGTAEKKSTS